MIVPAAALYIGLARPIIVALLQRGAFSAARRVGRGRHARRRSRSGCCRSRSTCSRCARSTSRHDTFTPFWLNCIENAVNIALAFPLYAWLGIPGLALAFALAYFVAAVAHARRARAAARRHRRGRGSATTHRQGRGRGRRRRRGELGRRRARSGGRAPATAIAGRRARRGRRRRRSYLGLLALLRVEELATLAALRPARRGPGRGPRAHACNDRRVRRANEECPCEHPSRHRQRCDLPAVARRRARHRDRARSRSASATRSSSTARSSAPTSSGTGSSTPKLLPETAAPSAGAFEAKFRELAGARRDRHRVHQPLVAPLGHDAGRPGRGGGGRRATARCR